MLILVAVVVGLATGNAVAAFLTFIAILVVMPFVATAMRATYQMRKGLPVRGYWNR